MKKYEKAIIDSIDRNKRLTRFAFTSYLEEASKNTKSLTSLIQKIFKYIDKNLCEYTGIESISNLDIAFSYLKEIQLNSDYNRDLFIRKLTRLDESIDRVSIENKDKFVNKKFALKELERIRKQIPELENLLDEDVNEYVIIKYIINKRLYFSSLDKAFKKSPDLVNVRDKNNISLYQNVLRKCIDSIYEKSSYKNFEIILVDNNSVEEKTFDMIKEYGDKYDNFRSIRLECEFNYSYINNEAVKVCKGDYILFLNNDTEVIDSDFIEYMLGYARLSHVGCVGIKLLFPDKLVQHAGVVLGFGGVAGHIYVANNYYDNGLFGRLVMPYNYTAVTAACLMISKKKFSSVGGFDEKLTVALNDVDLNLKLLDSGYYNVCLSNVSMYHYESKSRGYEASSDKHKRFLSEQEYMKKKWGKLLDRDKYFSKNNF